MRQRSERPGTPPFGDEDRRPAAAVDGDAPLAPDSGDGGRRELDGIVRRCAEGDPAAADELRAWEGGRLRGMLLRMLDDPALADRVLDAALADVRRSAAMLVAMGQGSTDDLVFALVRRHAAAAMRARGQAPPAMPLPQQRQPATAPWPAESTVLRPSPLADAPEPGPTEDAEPEPPAPVALGVAVPWDEPPSAPRARRPGFREIDGGDEAEDDDDEGRAGSGRRRWLLVALAWAVAGLLGFGVALLLIGDGRPPSVEAPSPAPASPMAVEPTTEARGEDGSEPPPAPQPQAPAPPPPVARDLLGDPLEAPEPPPLPAPGRPPPPPTGESPPPQAATPPAVRPQATLVPRVAEPPPQLPPPAAAAPVPVARLFVHHTAGDPDATARARAVAERLRDRGAAVVIVRPVPFAVRGLSVRYFHDADRAAATAAVADAAAVAGGLVAQGAALRPADFTSFRPAPRPGTIEIWLPGGS